MLKCPHESFCGDTHFVLLTFGFIFKVNIPKPNKESLITERDRHVKVIKTSLPNFQLL